MERPGDDSPRGASHRSRGLRVPAGVGAPPPPPSLSVRTDGGWFEPAGTTRSFRATVLDGFGIPRSGTAVRWSVAGVSALPASVVRTDEHGGSTFDFTAPRSGLDTVTVHADLDDDGERDEGEPVTSFDVRWAMAPPAEPTRVTLDGDRLDVSVTSRGNVEATRRDGLGAGRELFNCAAVCPTLVLRFTDGPPAGETFSNVSDHHPFYGDPQQAPVRTGDAVSQTSTYRVRWDDVDYVRVHQTTTVRDGESRIRVRYRLENLTGEPIGLRAGAVGAPRLAGSMYPRAGATHDARALRGSPGPDNRRLERPAGGPGLGVGALGRRLLVGRRLVARLGGRARRDALRGPRTRRGGRAVAGHEPRRRCQRGL